MSRRCTVILCVLGLVCFCVGVASATTYTFYDLSVVGDTTSYAYGINSSNEVVGRVYPGASVGSAFVWSPSFARTNLPTLGGTTAAGFAINNSGVVVGLAYNTSNSSRAFEWTPTVANGNSGTIANIGLKSPLSGTSRLLAINNVGQTVGYGQVGSSTPGFYWDGAASTVTVINAPANDIVTTNSGMNNSGINDSGMVVGNYDWGASVDLHGDCAVVWHPGDANSTNINPDIRAQISPTDTSIGSRALGVNNAGEIVGYYTSAFNVTGRPMLYKDSTHIVDLGPIPGGGVAGHAEAINATGTVVGWGSAGDGHQHAFIWTPTSDNATTGTMVDVNTLIPTGTLPTGYYCWDAYAINAYGSISGTIYNGTTYRAFALLAPVPEPSTLLLAVAGLVSLLAYAWRKRK
jgi:probable HAF family extracellular repeat protein